MNEYPEHDTDGDLKAALSASGDGSGDAPPFETVFAAAEARYRHSRQRYRWYVAAAAAAAVAAILIAMPATEPEYIQVADLMGTTQWTAPSDVLMPRHEFDIYQELPVLLESTKPVEGALL